MSLSNLLGAVSMGALALAVAVVPSARAQEQLPVIDVGTALPTSGGGDVGQGFGDGAGTNNGTDIGPGNNGQICADGVCNNPTSYAAPIESLGTKVNTPVMDTPLATKMITHQMLEDQQVTTLDEALRNVSGVYISGGGGAALGVPFLGVTIRGFTTGAYWRDGVRIDNFQGSSTGANSIEFANVQSVEVLKGPAAILYGAVEPGGIVNINTKQPLDHPAYSIQQQIGSYQSYRTTLDATGPLSVNKDLLYRFTASYENDGSFQTYGYNRNYMFDPVLKWNIDADTWIKAENQIQNNQLNQTFTWIPYYNNVIPLWLGRSQNLGVPSPLSQTQDFASVTWHHDFNKDWSIQQTAFMQTLSMNAANNAPYGLSDCITPNSTNCAIGYGGIANAVTIYGSPYTLNQRQAEYATVVDVTGHFKTQEIEHTMLLGADYYRFNSRSQNLTPAEPWTVTLFGNPASPPTTASPLTPVNAGEQYADNVGAYLQDQMKLPYGFQVLAGGRYQYINSRFNTTDSTNFCGLYSTNWANGIAIPCNFDTQTLRSQLVAQRVTPRSALLWRPLEWVSLYGNYVESYSPNYNGLLVLGTNEPNPPSAGQQVEGGVKFQFLDKKLQIQADYFHLVKTNIPVGIPNDFVHELVVGEARAEGPELDVQGELMPGWTINLGYSNINSKITKNASCSTNNCNYDPPLGSAVPYVPRNQANIASNYEFKDGVLKGFKVGARYDYVGLLPFFHYANDGTYLYGQSTPSYGLVGLLASYEFPYNGTTIKAQINVDNLFDRTYFTSGGLVPIPFGQDGGASPGWSSGYGQNTVIGAPRTIRGLIKVAF